MFEQEAIQYLNSLVSDNTFLSGDITGVNEVQETSEAVVGVLVGGDVKQKKIFITKIDSVFSWYYLSPISNDDLEYTTDDWNYPNYEKRIIAPVTLLSEMTGIMMFNWFQLNDMPVILRNSNAYLYCNEILPQHQTIVDSLSGVITVEDKP